jgi:hypothetical protein
MADQCELSKPLAQCPIDSPSLAGVGGEEDEEQKDKRDGIEFGPEVSPKSDAMPSTPPGRKRDVQHEERADDGSGSHEDAEDQRGGNPEFENPDHVSEEGCMRKYDVFEYRAVEGDCFGLNEPGEIFLKVAVRECRAGDFVFAEEQKEESGRDAGYGNRFWSCGWIGHSPELRLGGRDALPTAAETEALRYVARVSRRGRRC